MYKNHIANVQYLTRNESYGIGSYCLKNISYFTHVKNKVCHKAYSFLSECLSITKSLLTISEYFFSILGCFIGVFCTSSDPVYGLGHQIAMETLISFTKYGVFINRQSSKQ